MWRPPPPANLLLRISLYTGLWWVITEGQGDWRVGIIVIPIVALCAPLHAATWPFRLRWWLLPGFIVFVLQRSFIGALEVARLALQSRPLTNARTVRYPFATLSGSAEQLLMASLINLTPGTLTLRMLPDHLYIHVLHHRSDIEAQLSQLEGRIARLYGADNDT